MELDPFKEQWERQKDEPNAMWHCFQHFLTSGRVRHYKRTYRFLKNELGPEHGYEIPTPAAFEKYAADAKWKQRADAFDANSKAENQWLRERAVQSGHDLFIKGHSKLVKDHLKRLDLKLQEAIENIEDDNMHAADIGAIKSAIEYVVGEAHMGKVVPDDLLEEGMSAKRMSTEDAEKTKAILAEIFGTVADALDPEED